MPRRSLPLAALLLAATLGSTLLTPRPALAMLHPGDVAPDFRGTSLDGVSYRLFDFRGQVVVLFVLGSS
jgi:hypothetical protein